MPRYAAQRVTRYRRVRVRLWSEPKFKERDHPTRLVVLYLLSGPQTSAVGLYRLSVSSAAEDLAMPVSQFRRRFEAVLKEFKWCYESSSGLLWIPEWAQENTPQNPNIARSWRSAFDEIPESSLKAEAIAATFDHLQSKGTPFAKAFGDPFSKSVGESFRNDSGNTPDPVPDSPNRFGNDERRLANAASTRAIIGELHRRRSLA
jgi:hypothetical protein